MSLPAFNMRELIEAGVHFGHKTKRWNPRMAPFIYGVRNDIHIINLGKTVPMLHAALSAVKDVAAQNGRVLFVGTKRQASEPVAEAARRCGQYYINQRWLGGLLTNWKTIQASIKRLRKLDENLNTPNIGFTKKELLSMNRERDKLEASLGGIKDMGGLPDLIFIIDTGKEDLAVKEARNLNIPIVAIVDSNCSIDGISYPVPGNDDSSRAIRLYCQLVSDAVLAGLQESLSRSSKDLGEREDAGEIIPVDAQAEKKAADAKEDAEEAKKGKGRGKPAAKKAPVVTVKKTPGKK
ncbi:MAG: 30S ribosomal protein S2 [Alphaproteobacteria bacterium]|nr:30S ribosomal protein S2 [Alphaproteobacteria bacterium]